MSRRLIHILQIGFGVILIALLFYGENLGVQAIRNILDSSLKAVLILVLLSLAMNWISALKWFMLARARELNVSMTRLTVLYLIGKFFSNFVPGMIGGDISRSYLFGRYIGSQTVAAASIFLERFTGLLTLVVLVAIATVLRPEVLGSPLIGWSIALISAACFVALILLFVSDLRRLLDRLAGGIAWIERLLPTLDRLFNEIAFFRRNPMTLIGTLVLSCIFYLLASISMLVACQAVGLPVMYNDVAHATPVIYLATAIPVSPSNLGWWEWCVGLVLTNAEYTLSQGIAVGLLIRAVTLLVSLVGGLLFLGYRQQRPDANSEAAR